MTAKSESPALIFRFTFKKNISILITNFNISFANLFKVVSLMGTFNIFICKNLIGNKR